MDKMINLQKRVRNSVKLPNRDPQHSPKDYFVTDSNLNLNLVKEPESEVIPSENIESEQTEMLDSIQMVIDDIQPENEKEPNETPMCIFDINPESKFMHQGIDK